MFYYMQWHKRTFFITKNDRYIFVYVITHCTSIYTFYDIIPKNGASHWACSAAPAINYSDMADQIDGVWLYFVWFHTGAACFCGWTSFVCDCGRNTVLPRRVTTHKYNYGLLKIHTGGHRVGGVSPWLLEVVFISFIQPNLVIVIIYRCNLSFLTYFLSKHKTCVYHFVDC